MEEVALIAAVLFVGVLPMIGIGYVAYRSFAAPQAAKRRAVAELRNYHHPTLVLEPSPSSDEVGVLSGEVRGYSVRITPDEENKIWIELASDPGLQLLIAGSLDRSEEDHFDFGDPRLDGVFTSRRAADGQRRKLLDDAGAMAALRAFVQEWGRKLRFFSLSGQQLIASPIEGYRKHSHFITPAQIEGLLPALLDLAQGLDRARLGTVPLDEKAARCTSFMEPLAHALGSNVVQDGDRIVVRGRINDRSCLAFIFPAGMEAVFLSATLPTSSGGYVIKHGPATQSSDQPLADDVHVGFDGKDAALAALGSFTPEERDALLAFMRSVPVDELNVTGKRFVATLRLPVAQLDAAQLPDYLRQHVTMADVFEIANARGAQG